MIDVAIVGAGPAGLTVLEELGKHNVEALLIDEQPQAGGQIYRSLTRNLHENSDLCNRLGESYTAGKNLCLACMIKLRSYYMHGYGI